MNRLKKLGTALAMAGLMATYVPTATVLAQVDPNAPIEVSVDILLQVDSNQPKRQTNATYEIVDETGNVVYRHESDAQTSEVPKLAAGKYRLRLYDGQGFKRDDKEIKAQKVETSIPKRSEQDIAANKQLQEQEDKGSLKTNDEGQTYYEVPFEVKPGPDLETPDHQKMVTKLAVTLSNQEESTAPTPATPAQPSQSESSPAKGSAAVRVIDEAGSPVADARLHFNGVDFTTDANGQVTVEALEPGQYPYGITSLPAGYEGSFEGTADVAANARKEITLTVAKVTNMPVVFNVVDEAGNPVAGATVTLNGQTAVSDQAGKAIFQDVAPGEYDYQLTALPEAYQGQASGRIAVVSGQDSSINLTVQAKPQAPATHRLTIRVVDAAGQAVAGAKLQVDDQVGATDEAGQAVFEDVTAGSHTYALMQAPEGYTGNPQGTLDMPTDQDHLMTLQVEKEVESSSSAPEVKRDLKVKLYDQEDAPVVGATVTVEDQTATTDENGVAQFTGLTPGMIRYALTQLPAGYEGLTNGEAELPSDTDHSITLRVTKQAPESSQPQTVDMTVTVQDNEGQAVEGAEVKVGDQVATTDASGKAQFKGLTPGQVDYQITRLPDGYEGNQSGQTDASQGLTLNVTKKPAPVQKRDLTVKVLDDAGKEVADVSVKVGDQILQTDANGQAVFRGLTPGTFHYEIVNLPEHYTGVQAGDAELPSDTDHSITLTVTRQQALAKVTVKVMDENNQPVPGVAVYLGGLEGTTDDQGNIIFDELEAGKYTYGIKSVPDGYQVESTEQTQDIAPGADLHPILKVRHRAQVATLALTVVNVAGQPVSGVTLAVGNQQLTTDDKGMVTFQDLQAGDYEYQVVSVPEPYQLDQTKIKLTLASGQTAQRTIQLVEKAAVSQSQDSSSEAVTATKTSGVERKDGNLPSTGEQVMGWLTPLAIALVALGGAILFYRRRKDQQSGASNEDDGE